MKAYVKVVCTLTGYVTHRVTKDKYKRRVTYEKGFTIIELMIVIAIITILARVLISKASIGKVEAKARGVEQNAQMVKAYMELHKEEIAFQRQPHVDYHSKQKIDGAKLLAMLQKEEDFMTMTNPYHKEQKGVTDVDSKGCIRVCTGSVDSYASGEGFMIIHPDGIVSYNAKPWEY